MTPDPRYSVTRRVAKPLLASEVLADEEAPREPGKRAIRLWMGIATALLGGIGLALHLGYGDPSAGSGSRDVSFGAAILLGTLALVRIPYALRAVGMTGLGVTLMVLGLQGKGPLGGLAVDGGMARDAMRLVMMAFLPAGLVLRGRYPSYPPSRIVMVIAVLASLPFVIAEIELALSSGAPGLPRWVAGIELVLVLGSLIAFAAAPSIWSPTHLPWWLILALSAEMGVRELTPLAGSDAGSFTYLLTGVGLLAIGGITGAGVFQLLALVVGPRARADLERAQQVRRQQERQKRSTPT